MGHCHFLFLDCVFFWSLKIKLPFLSASSRLKGRWFFSSDCPVSPLCKSKEAASVLRCTATQQDHLGFLDICWLYNKNQEDAAIRAQTHQLILNCKCEMASAGGGQHEVLIQQNCIKWHLKALNTKERLDPMRGTKKKKCMSSPLKDLLWLFFFFFFKLPLHFAAPVLYGAGIQTQPPFIPDKPKYTWIIHIKRWPRISFSA